MERDSETKATKTSSTFKFEIKMNTQKRQYIAPESTSIIDGVKYTEPAMPRKINGVEVIAKEFGDKLNFQNTSCTNCEISKQNICFDKATKKSLPTRPACFGNDPENLSNKPLYYTKL